MNAEAGAVLAGSFTGTPFRVRMVQEVEQVFDPNGDAYRLALGTVEES
jgi:hypothetical protein